MRHSLCPAFALLPLLLAACAPPASLQPASGGPQVQGDGRCQAGPVAWAVGKVADEATLARIRKESGAGLVRSIAPGQPTTRDLREDRVNVFVGADNVIGKVSCG
jgi:hypothetical protein